MSLDFRRSITDLSAIVAALAVAVCAACSPASSATNPTALDATLAPGATASAMPNPTITPASTFTPTVVGVASPSSTPTAAVESPTGAPTAGNPVSGTTPAAATSTAANGCQEQQAPADAAARPADVTIGSGSGLGTPSATLLTGQILEVRLTAVMHWTLTQQDPGQHLAAMNRNDWYDGTDKVCVWRFTALGPGTIILIYNGRAVCPFRSVCPNLVVEQEYTITISQ